MTDTATLALAVPEPDAGLDVTGLHSLCASITAEMVHVFEVGPLREAHAKLAAIDAYLDATSTEGRKTVQATMRRLEARCGWLLGEATPGRPKKADAETSTAVDVSGLTKDEKVKMRKMAAHPDVVEAVIEASTDEDPPSRRKVLRAIDEATAEPDVIDEDDEEDPDYDRRAAERLALLRRVVLDPDGDPMLWVSVGLDLVGRVLAEEREVIISRVFLDELFPGDAHETDRRLIADESLQLLAACFLAEALQWHYEDDDRERQITEAAFEQLQAIDGERDVATVTLGEEPDDDDGFEVEGNPRFEQAEWEAANAELIQGAPWGTWRQAKPERLVELIGQINDPARVRHALAYERAHHQRPDVLGACWARLATLGR